MQNTLLSKTFRAQPWFERLRRRGPNFEYMVNHASNFLQKHHSCTIIETGCARSDNNWEGDGHSTYIWDWLAKQDSRYKVHSIDITPENIELASKKTERVKYWEGDSVIVLNNQLDYFEDLVTCGVLYLDSFDWSPNMNMESSFHHVMELATVWRALPRGCLVAVDDRKGEMQGKHWMVGLFMEQLGLKPVFKNEQIGWVKP